jgi:hypothetical protein
MLLIETNPQLVAAEAKKQALNNAILLVFIEKRTTTYFLCLREERLWLANYISKFVSLRDLTKHFKRKHLAYIKKGDQLECKVCQIRLQYKQYLQNHTLGIHRTVL